MSTYKLRKEKYFEKTNEKKRCIEKSSLMTPVIGEKGQKKNTNVNETKAFNLLHIIVSFCVVFL